MIRRWTVPGLLLLLACQANIAAVADDVLSVRASPTVMTAPGVIRLLVRVERDPANRTLMVEVDSLALFRSSLITLQGKSAQAVYWLEFDSLPAGTYTATATLRRDDDATMTAEDKFTVVP